MARERNSALHVVLLAGGSGTRFWPLSRGRRPKQFLDLGSGESLLRETWRRVRKLAPPRRIWVVAPRALRRDVLAELKELREENLIVEPTPRDTAPAVGLACAVVARRDPTAVVGIFPTDHVIRNSDAFVRSVKVATRSAARDSLVCLGVRPDRPATGFGYLECSSPPRGLRAVDVRRFVEKPPLARARRFLQGGRHLWNAGMFVWRANRFLEELRRTAPEIAAAVEAHVDGRRGAWNRAPKKSVDYAVMEHAVGVRVVPLDAGWDDVGSWDAAVRLLEERGSTSENTIRVDSSGSAVFGGSRLVAFVDAPDLVIVDTEDALLVVSRSQSEKVRAIVDELRRRERDDLL